MIRVGIIGCGKIAQVRHLPEYAANPHVELAGYYDLNTQRAQEMAAQYGGKVYESYFDLLNDPSIDAVSICVENRSHAEISTAALYAGKHVLCEKPMAVTLAECESMVAAAERNGKQVGHEHAEQDRDDLHHAEAPDVRDDDDSDRDDGDEPVRRGVRDSGARENKADRDNDRARDHGREELHHAKRAEAAEQRGEHEVQKTSARHAQASIGQKLGLAVRCDSGIARDEGERRAKECRHLPLREEVEQKRTQAREQKRGRNRESREHRNQDGGAEHGEHVLQAEDDHLGLAERGRIIDGIGAVLGPHCRYRFVEFRHEALLLWKLSLGGILHARDERSGVQKTKRPEARDFRPLGFMVVATGFEPVTPAV